MGRRLAESVVSGHHISGAQPLVGTRDLLFLGG